MSAGAPGNDEGEDHHNPHHHPLDGTGDPFVGSQQLWDGSPSNFLSPIPSLDQDGSFTRDVFVTAIETPVFPPLLGREQRAKVLASERPAPRRQDSSDRPMRLRVHSSDPGLMDLDSEFVDIESFQVLLDGNNVTPPNQDIQHSISDMVLDPALVGNVARHGDSNHRDTGNGSSGGGSSVGGGGGGRNNRSGTTSTTTTMMRPGGGGGGGKSNSSSSSSSTTDNHHLRRSTEAAAVEDCSAARTPFNCYRQQVSELCRLKAAEQSRRPLRTDTVLATVAHVLDSSDRLLRCLLCSHDCDFHFLIIMALRIIVRWMAGVVAGGGGGDGAPLRDGGGGTTSGGGGVAGGGHGGGGGGGGIKLTLGTWEISGEEGVAVTNVLIQRSAQRTAYLLAAINQRILRPGAAGDCGRNSSGGGRAGESGAGAATPAGHSLTWEEACLKACLQKLEAELARVIQGSRRMLDGL